LLCTCTQVSFEDPFTGENALAVPIISLIGPNPYYMNVNEPYNEPGATAFDTTDGVTTDITDSIKIKDGDVSTDSAGEHTVKYYVTGLNGIRAKAERTVIVKDIVGPDKDKPVITLLGLNPTILFTGETYIEEGATAYDSVDGDLSDDIQIYGDTVVTDEPDSFEVWYMVSDKAGNTATKVRYVWVFDGDDSIPPVITLLGDSIIKVNAGAVYHDSGATAFDDIDGDITSRIKVSGSVDMLKLGSYYLYYDVEDNAGNKAEQKRRSVTVVDTTGPTISITPPNPINIYAGTPYVEYGATAHDNLDGDVTHKIDTINDSVNTSVPGVYRVHYRVQDNAGYKTDSVRVINVLDFADTIPPVITLLGNNPLLLDIGQSYTEAGAKATDNKDGDITDRIEINDDSVNTSTQGTYRVHYTVSDNAGNTDHEIRIVLVGVNLDTIPPVITLLGDNPMTIEINDPYNEPGATAIDNEDGNISSKIEITGTVDNTKIGTYTRTYNVSDNSGNKATPKERSVKVVDQIIPDWEIGVSYSVGDLVTYNGQVYRCLQAHTSQPGWEPPNALALWQPQK
jgi:hypothetical protein